MVTAIFPTISNPPTFGMILGLRYIEDLYDKIFVVVYDKPKVINTYQVVIMLKKVLCKSGLKYSVITNKTNFETVTTLPPELPKFERILTDNTRIYSNLLHKGHINVTLIPKPIGWDESFHRVAYQRSVALEGINNSIKTISDPEGYVEDLKESKRKEK